MIQPNNILETARFAVKHHGEQRRKYDNMPYIVHPLNVAARLAEFCDMPDAVIQAAILHDVLEDTDCTVEELRENFHAKVCEWVIFLTDEKPREGMNRADRKRLDLERLKQSPWQVGAIKFADMLDNMESIYKHDPLILTECNAIFHALSGQFNRVNDLESQLAYALNFYAEKLGIKLDEK